MARPRKGVPTFKIWENPDRPGYRYRVKDHLGNEIIGGISNEPLETIRAKLQKYVDRCAAKRDGSFDKDNPA